MYQKIYSALKTRFGTDNAVKIMIALTLFSAIGLIASIKASIFMTVVALSTVVTPFVIGLVYAFTRGHVNLAAIFETWMVNSIEGMVFGIVLLVVAQAIILYQFPKAIDRWASGKVFTK